ncbi:DNA cross-link repair 1 protein [Tetrabaena socialis]|uniref:DNA cross-link repair 1 protein n=1 Tax=Tetrabaena socialis TaxID=47790 RepID=A0A2J7ZY59_9CHLO|nr:DNA cross-link repair 1 protein [Tetrabaena socialis]|eukprot:PNH05209.1 DNA cross-link repair 1 protein [Tetrabaena socialis]
MASQVESIKWVPGTDFLVDGFKFKTPRCAHYFLTHFHSDHTIGLSKGFSGGLIYCSHVTARLLIHDMGLRAQFVRPLEVGRPVVISGVRVTPLDANHCPGAVMFLFELPIAQQPAPGPGKGGWEGLDCRDAAAAPGAPGAGRVGDAGAGAAEAGAGARGAHGWDGGCAGAGAQTSGVEMDGAGGCISGCEGQLLLPPVAVKEEEGQGEEEGEEEEEAGAGAEPLGLPARMEGRWEAAEGCRTPAVQEAGREAGAAGEALAVEQEGGEAAACWREGGEAAAHDCGEEEEEDSVVVLALSDDGEEGPCAGGGEEVPGAGAAQEPGGGGGSGSGGGGGTAPATHNVLHTGDCRWQRWMRHQPGLGGMRVDTVFLDTTYAAPKHTMPPQQEAIDMMAQAMREARAEEPSTLFVVAMYHIGKERALFGAAQQLGAKVRPAPVSDVIRRPVWCSDAKKAVLRLLDLPPEQMGMLVEDAREADVHVAGWGLRPEELQAYLDQFEGGWKRVVGVRATGWTLRQKGGVSVRREGDVVILGVPYSEHSSWNDLCDAVSQLRPSRLIPTVNAGTAEQRRALVDRFAALMDLRKDRSRWQRWMRHQPGLGGMRVDTVFLDTTYAAPKHTMPPQQEAIDMMAQVGPDLCAAGLDVYLSRGGSTPLAGRAAPVGAAAAARRRVDLGAVDLAEQQRILADLQQRAQQQQQQQSQQQQRSSVSQQRKRKRQDSEAAAAPGSSSGARQRPREEPPRVRSVRARGSGGSGASPCPAGSPPVKLEQPSSERGRGPAAVEQQQLHAATGPLGTSAFAGLDAAAGSAPSLPLVVDLTMGDAQEGGEWALDGGAPNPDHEGCAAVLPARAQQAPQKDGRWQASIRSFFAPVGRALGL